MSDLAAYAGGPIRSVLVVVPAHDEEELLGRCLRSVAASVKTLARTHPDVATRTIVVLDACADGSSAIASAHAVDVLRIERRCVGAARASGVRRGRLLDAAHAEPAARCWLSCTDADSAVPPDWLTSQVLAADGGADVVLGAVRPDPHDVDHALLLAWREAHDVATALTPAVHGANLGVRMEAYLKAGGFPSVPQHEDVALVRELAARGARCAEGVTVLTSGRRTGRAPGGFAGFLEHLRDGREAAPVTTTGLHD